LHDALFVPVISGAWVPLGYSVVSIVTESDACCVQLCDSESGESYDRSSLCKYDHLLMYNQFSCPLCVVHIKIVCSEYENSHAVA